MRYAFLAMLQWALILLGLGVPWLYPDMIVAWIPALIGAIGALGAATIARTSGGGGGGPSPGDLWDMQTRYQGISSRYGDDAAGEIKAARKFASGMERERGRLMQYIGSGRNEGYAVGEPYPWIAPLIPGRPETARGTGGWAEQAYYSGAGQAVDRYMRRAGEMSDPSSEGYQELYTAYTDPSLERLEAGRVQGGRAITAERRATEREIRNVGAGRGAARQPYAVAALGARAGEQAATQLANLELETEVEASRLLNETTWKMAEYGDMMTRDAVEFAQSYVDNAAGVRDEYVGMQVNLRLAMAQIYGNLAGAALGVSGQAVSALGGMGTASIRADTAMDIARLQTSLALAGTIAGIATGSYGSTTETPQATRRLNISDYYGVGAGTTQPPSRDEYARMATYDRA
jgi:hypothetical protein